MKNKATTVVFATDENYAPYASAAIASLTAVTPSALEIYIFYSLLSLDTVRKLESAATDTVTIQCIDVSGYIKDAKNLYPQSYCSTEMYYRLLIPEVLSSRDKVLYLDCDLTVLSDVSELFNTDLGNKIIGGVRNVMHEKMKMYVKHALLFDYTQYINSGVLLINCVAFRAEKVKERCFALLEERGDLLYPDQDLLNLVFNGRIYYLPPEWNYAYHYTLLNRCSNPALHLLPEYAEEYAEAEKNMKILHFTGGVKPWHSPKEKFADLFWANAKNCPFYAEIIYSNLKKIAEADGHKTAERIAADAVKKATAEERKKIAELQKEVFKRRGLGYYIKAFFRSIKSVGILPTLKKVFKKIFG